jgi:DNA-binding response OmpR family regulator
MLGQENSDARWAFPAGKRPRRAGARRRSPRAKQQGDGSASDKRFLLFGRLRELALYRAEVLRQNGFDVITPSDQTEAVAAIESGGWGAVILSYTLSSQTVEEMAELVKQKCPQCPLIAISQTGLVDRRIAPDEVVIADHGPAALLAAVERVMRRRAH